MKDRWQSRTCRDTKDQQGSVGVAIVSLLIIRVA